MTPTSSTQNQYEYLLIQYNTCTVHVLYMYNVFCSFYYSTFIRHNSITITKKYFQLIFSSNTITITPQMKGQQSIITCLQNVH